LVPLVCVLQLGIIEISLNRLVNGATACLVVNVSSSCGCQKNIGSQSRHFLWSSLTTSQLVPVLFVPATSTHILLKWNFCQLTCLEQSISIRYLWTAFTISLKHFENKKTDKIACYLKAKFFLSLFTSAGGGGWNQSLNLDMMRRVFYHCTLPLAISRLSCKR